MKCWREYPLATHKPTFRRHGPVLARLTAFHRNQAPCPWSPRRILLGSALTLRAIMGREPRSLREYFAELSAEANGGAERKP